MIFGRGRKRKKNEKWKKRGGKKTTKDRLISER
jgi:hypothetical protein